MKYLTYGRLIRSTLLAVMVAAPIWSETIVFDTLPAVNMYGTYNGFVGGTMDGVRFNDLVCDDFFSTTYIPSGPWQYEISTLPTLANARFGSDSEAIQRYKLAAILLAGNGAMIQGLLNVSDAAVISDYQYALWHLFSPSVGLQGNSASLLTTVQGLNLSDGTFAPIYARLKVWTPVVNAVGNQEMLQLGAAVPEPGTIGMLASGLALFALAAPRLRRQKQS